MNDEERDMAGLSGGEDEVVRRLTSLSPLMQEQEAAQAEMDQVFARNLRAHLVHGEEYAPHPRFARNLRTRLVHQGIARPVTKSPRPRLIVWVSAAAVALLTLVGGLSLTVLRSHHAQVPSFSAPYPTKTDLIFSFPVPPMVIHSLTPTVSLVHSRSGVPYAGHLRLSPGRLQRRTPPLRAYRLASPANVTTVGRSLLGIHSGVHLQHVGGATWTVAADGGFPSRRPLHSLAVSRRTGEFIYHDRRNLALPRATRALARTTAVSVARGWLMKLGWPGKRMPVTAVASVQYLPKVREVEFGWIGVGTTGIDAATLWITPNRSVIEAWVWPPVTQESPVSGRPISAAWTAVQQGTVPLSVLGVPSTTRADGAGALQRTTVVSIPTSGPSGDLYLVPTYRFEGTAHIRGERVHTWFSLAPGAQQ